MLMIYFLVKATICYTPYMGNDQKIEDIRLVLASDVSEAQRKYEMYWEKKCENHGDSYWIKMCDVQETII
jgi:hypothetical protein